MRFPGFWILGFTLFCYDVSAIFFTIITLYFSACQIMIFVLTLLPHLKCKV